jgi:UDP-N-acetylmuramyl pentapeptide phosphotransferase/UDP-N-acetylglucosamine-1-phosphate transferase
MFLYLLFIPLFFLVMRLYFKIADHYNIIDHPNERSSHSEITIRGGGIIFLFAALCALVLHPEYWMPILGMFLIGIISFVDDRITLSGKIRIIFHLSAVTLLFIFLGLFGLFPWWITLLIYIVVIGIVNAYNFMDGINGITGLYSLVVLLGLQYINYNSQAFVPVNLIWLPILASLIFLFYNFRTKARCFAGDVGSITIAFWIVFLLLALMIQTANISYILFLAIYGVDTILTIIHRLFLKQNIFDAHRLHFYQILANEQKWPQLLVSAMYALVQLGIIVAVVFSSWSILPLFLVTIVPLMAIYILLKPRLMNKTKVKS